MKGILLGAAGVAGGLLGGVIGGVWGMTGAQLTVPDLLLKGAMGAGGGMALGALLALVLFVVASKYGRVVTEKQEVDRESKKEQ